jgi:hypothetical protein
VKAFPAEGGAILATRGVCDDTRRYVEHQERVDKGQMQLKFEF